MINLIKKLTLISFLSIYFLLHATETIYEDAEDGDTIPWAIYDASPAGATITNIYDTVSNSQVIKLEGQGTNNGYVVGGWPGEAHAWHELNHTKLSFQINYQTPLKFYVITKTSKGLRYMYYSTVFEDRGILSTRWIHHGLGTSILDGTWHAISRDIKADLLEFEPDNYLISIEGIQIRGSGMIDNIILSQSLPTPDIQTITDAIHLYRNSDGSYRGSDALVQSIRGDIDIDIYRKNHSLYFEWDEKDMEIDDISIYKHLPAQTEHILYRAKSIQHRWNWYFDNDLKPEQKHGYTLTLKLHNGETLNQYFEVNTTSFNKLKPKSQFKFYDDLEGGKGDKGAYLAEHTKDATMAKYGLQNSIMYWVDWFYEPIPKLSDSNSRLLAAANIPKLQSFIRDDLEHTLPHKRIFPDSSIIVLDIEHVPTKLEYVAKEFSPYGPFFPQYRTSKEVLKNGRKIISHTIAKKLDSIQAVKNLLPDTPIGLWGGVVTWNRYADNAENYDYNALAKGVNHKWRINYPRWHEHDMKLYKAYVDVVDYVMPVLYPMFDISTAEGKQKQAGYVLTLLSELKRLNPNVTVIPSISPHYTSGWTKKAHLQHSPIAGADFKWYLNLLYDYYEKGMLDSLHIWGDNDDISFEEFTQQAWWNELLLFNKEKGLY